MTHQTTSACYYYPSTFDVAMPSPCHSLCQTEIIVQYIPQAES